MSPPSKLLCDEDRLLLLARAREAINQIAVQQRIPDFPPVVGRLAEPGGAFVTVRCNGRLRGCIGRVDADTSLAETVAQAAIGAALHDPRFPPIRECEIANLRIEISAVSELRRSSPGEIAAGTHGVVVMSGDRRGLLLPQVATERGWPANRLLEETCVKAGLDRGAWRDSATQIFTFTAEIFSEPDVG